MVATKKPQLIDGGRRNQVRRKRGQDVTPEQIEIFLGTLAETCNISRSARAANFSQSWAYRLRKRDASFRAGWLEAVREGYAKLELVLLERAMKGTPRPIMRRDGSERIVREYSTQLAVALLRGHREMAEEANREHDLDEMREVRERIIGKLEMLRQRDVDQSGIETKGFDPIGLIARAIGKHRHRAVCSQAAGPAPALDRER